VGWCYITTRLIPVASTAYTQTTQKTSCKEQREIAQEDDKIALDKLVEVSWGGNKIYEAHTLLLTKTVLALISAGQTGWKFNFPPLLSIFGKYPYISNGNYLVLSVLSSIQVAETTAKNPKPSGSLMPEARKGEKKEATPVPVSQSPRNHVLETSKPSPGYKCVLHARVGQLVG
jgi:hypothetical protein